MSMASKMSKGSCCRGLAGDHELALARGCRRGLRAGHRVGRHPFVGGYQAQRRHISVTGSGHARILPGADVATEASSPTPSPPWPPASGIRIGRHGMAGPTAATRAAPPSGRRATTGGFRGSSWPTAVEATPQSGKVANTTVPGTTIEALFPIGVVGQQCRPDRVGPGLLEVASAAAYTQSVAGGDR